MNIIPDLTSAFLDLPPLVQGLSIMTVAMGTVAANLVWEGVKKAVSSDARATAMENVRLQRSAFARSAGKGSK